MRDADRDKLKANLASVEERIAAACARAGRKRNEVTLVAVTKYVDVDVARMLIELGVTDLGESRPQELWRKAAAIPEARWHLVGHLQRNKVASTLPVVQMIHSVDSFRLIEAIEDEAKKQARFVLVQLEFNLSGEEAKHGFQLADVADIATRLETLVEPLQHVRIAGLMTMSALDATPEAVRTTFIRLRSLKDELARVSRKAPIWHYFCHLSMGMTNDFEIAIEEGATLVRIGSALFEGLETRTT